MSNKKVDCNKVCELLIVYLDGETTPAEKAYIERHLDDCPQCRAELTSLSATRESLRNALKSAAEEMSPRPDVWGKVKKRIPGKYGRPGFRIGSLLPKVAIAFAGIFVIAIAVFVWQFMRMGAGSPNESYTGMMTPAATTAVPTTTATTTVAVPTQTSIPAPTTTVPPTTMEPPAKYIDVKATFDKANYVPGEAVNAVVSFSNVAHTPRDIEPYPPVIEVIAGTGSVVNTIQALPSVTNLLPGETTTYTVTWNQDDQSGNRVPYGRYMFFVPNKDTPEDASSLGNVYILPPEGIIEKTITIVNTEIAAGISVTLEKVDLSANGIRFYVYSSDISPPVYDSGDTIHALAGYSLNSGPVQEFSELTSIGWASNTDRVDFLWAMFIPVARGTHELTFIIFEFGSVTGPWEFKVKLG